MKLKNMFKHYSSIVYVWLFSYVAMFLIPLTMGIVVYFIANDIIQGEIIRSNSVILQQSKQRVESIINEVTGLSAQISSNPRTDAVLKSSASDSGLPYKMYELSKDLKVYLSGLNYINDFYIYFRDIDYIMTPNLSMNGKDIYQMYLFENTKNYTEWYENLFEHSRARFKKMLRTDSYNNTKKTISYIQPIPFYKATNYNAVIVVMLDEGTLIDSFKNEELFGKGAFVILDSDDNPLVSVGDVPDLTKLEFSDENDLYTGWYNTDLFFTYIKSEKTGFKHIGINPKNVFWSKTRNFRNIVWIFIGVYVLLGIFIIRFFLKKNYKPVKDLMGMFDEDTFKGDENNEFRFIKENISNTIFENKQITEELDSNNKNLFSSFLIKVVEGEYNKGNTDNHMLEMFNSYFTSDYFCVLAFHIKNLDALFSGDDMTENARLKLARLIITNIADEVLQEKYTSIFLVTGNMLISVINIKESDTETFISDIDEMMVYCNDNIYEHFKFKFSVASGGLHKFIEGIRHSYKESLTTMEYKIIFKQDDLLCYDQIENVPKEKYYSYPLEQEMQLVNNIKSGNAEVAIETVRRIFKDNFENQVYSIQIARCFMFDMISTMIRILDEIFGQQGNSFLNETGIVERLIECKSVQEIHENIITLIQEVCKYVDSKTEHHLEAKVFEYLNKNYKDPNVSVNQIANHLGMNSNYLSTAFKEQSGERLSDYINKIRLENADKLLKNTTYTIEEIAQQTGYVSSRTFMRLFKKYRGVTPSEFRKMDY